MFDSKFAETLIDAALSFGADAAEVYYSRERNTEIMVNDGQAEMVNVKSDNGFAVRILRDSRMAFASSNLSDRKAAVDLVRSAAAGSLLNSPDEYNVIPEPVDDVISDVEEPFDPEIEPLPLSTKVELAIGIERAAKAYDSRIRGFGWLQYGDSVQEYSVFNSHGVNAQSKGTIAYTFALAIASDDKSVQTGTHIEASAYFTGLSAERIGITAAKYAVRMLGATAIKTARYPLILPPEVSCALLGALVDMLSADQVQKGKSPFRNRLGDVIASKNVTIIDDGVLRGGLATCTYDSEGVPSATTPLIESGLLKSFLYDSYSAKKGGTRSTGNASKSSYHDQPSISPTNFYLKPGKTAAEDLVGSVSSGLYLTEVSGLHAGINPTTADFSVPAKALIVKEGEFAGAVDNITISGNMLEFLRNVELVASDLKWIPGHGVIGAPTMKIGETKVAGR